MRLFVATMLPAADDRHYAGVIGALSPALRGVVRAVPDGTAHITHAFLGEVPDNTVPGVLEVAETGAATTPTLDVALGAPDILMSRGGPRLVLVPVTAGRPALFDLQVSLTLALRSVPGLALLPMPKSPHVTIARFSRRATARDGAQAREALARLHLAARPLRIARLCVMKSTLTPAGPIHEEIAGFALTGA